jgi:diamine N-acetyltransferase
MPEVELREVDAANWREVATVEPREDQRGFVATVPYYLALCHYGGVWNPVGLYEEDRVVGFAMWGVDQEDDSRWIGGLTIDQRHQGKGYGRAAVERLISFLRDQPGCSGIALSYRPENETARRLYASLGFRETGENRIPPGRQGEMEDGEMVARLDLR